MEKDGEMTSQTHYEWNYRLRFQDADAAGILFYARLFDIFHDAYVCFLEELGRPLWKSIETSDTMIPLVHAEADYLSPLRFGDPIKVAIGVKRLGKKSFTLQYSVNRQEDGRMAATGETVHVAVDRENFQSVILPKGLQQALGRFHT